MGIDSSPSSTCRVRVKTALEGKKEYRSSVSIPLHRPPRLSTKHEKLQPSSDLYTPTTLKLGRLHCNVRCLPTIGYVRKGSLRGPGQVAKGFRFERRKEEGGKACNCRAAITPDTLRTQPRATMVSHLQINWTGVVCWVTVDGSVEGLP